MSNNTPDINIRYGTLQDWERSDKNINDIVFLTDLQMIKARGKTYGGNGVPTWDGESQAYSDPTKLFTSLYRALKKPLYLKDEKCPKFDIYIKQRWVTLINTDLNGKKYREDHWATDNKFNLYKMWYDESRTEFMHLTSDAASGKKVVFKFPIVAGADFTIHPCSEGDWLCPNGMHDLRDPEWDSSKQDYCMTYKYDCIADDSKKYFSELADETIRPKANGYVIVEHPFANVTQDKTGQTCYPKVIIRYSSI